MSLEMRRDYEREVGDGQLTCNFWKSNQVDKKITEKDIIKECMRNMSNLRCDQRVFDKSTGAREGIRRGR